MNPVCDLNLLHLVLFPLRQEALSHGTPCDLSINDELAIGDPVKIGLRFRRSTLSLMWQSLCRRNHFCTSSARVHDAGSRILNVRFSASSRRSSDNSFCTSSVTPRART